MKKMILVLAMLIFSIDSLFGDDTVTSVANKFAAHPILIGIGHDCEIAQQLRKNGLRHEAYPFDWNQTFDFDGVIQVFEEDFQGFLDPAYLVNHGVYIFNTYYRINFIHDFPNLAQGQIFTDAEVSTVADVLPNFLDSLSLVQTKYERRIERLKRVLASGNRIIFFRISATPTQAEKFMRVITAKYPGLDFSLVVLHSEKALNYDWKIKNVRSFYLEELIVPGLPADHLLKNWKSDREWKNVLYALRLL